MRRASACGLKKRTTIVRLSMREATHSPAIHHGLRMKPKSIEDCADALLLIEMKSNTPYMIFRHIRIIDETW
jgi:hypothetical protein